MAGPSWSTLKLWELVAQITTPRNFKVLYGRQEAGKNTVGETKAAVHRCIADVLKPDLFQQNTKKAIECVKRKITDLESKFKEHVQRLKKTGEGVNEYYTISKDGPDHDTNKRAVNIWEQIKKDFPFFPELWKFWSTRPNFVPICVTTGITPRGPPTTMFLQPLHHDEVPAPPTRPPTPVIDPILIQYNLESAAASAAASATQAISRTPSASSNNLDSSDNGETSQSAPTSRRGPCSSTFPSPSTAAPAKPSLEDEIISTSKDLISKHQRRSDQLFAFSHARAHQKYLIEQHKLVAEKA